MRLQRRADHLDHDRLAALRWFVAALIVVTAHATAAWTFLYWRPALTVPPQTPPAVMIDLAPVAVAPEAPKQDVAPGPQMTEAAPKSDPDSAAAEGEKLPDLPKKDSDAVIAPARTEEKPKQQHKKEQRKSEDAKQKQAPRTSAPAASRVRRGEVSAAPSRGISPASSASMASWKAEVVARLNRYKRFPPGAAKGGTALVAFSMNRSGSVTSSSLVRSSGDSVLDREAVSLPRRASPLPPPPSGMGGGSLSLSVPVRFNR